MPKWPWIERIFSLDFPVTKMPDLIERVRGTPARVADLIAGVAPDILTRRPRCPVWPMYAGSRW